jgi:hypothetical protein
LRRCCWRTGLTSRRRTRTAARRCTRRASAAAWPSASCCWRTRRTLTRLTWCVHVATAALRPIQPRLTRT